MTERRLDGAQQRAEAAALPPPGAGTVALGCGNFGGIGSAPAFFGQGIEHDEAFAIMDRAWGAGIGWFDTGDAYGGGTSERWIGEWMRERGVRPKLTTKVFHSTTGTPGDTGLAPERIRRQIRASLERLGVERVDYYLAHEPDESVPLEETIACFELLLDEGVIGAWGLSNYELAAIRRTSPSLVQNSFSLLERADENDILPHCRERGIPYVPFGPLAGGWLTGKYRRGEAYPEGSRMTQRPGGYAHYNDDRVFDALEALADEAASRGVSMAGLAFAWVMHRCDGAVCGPNRAAHLDPVLEAMQIELTNEDVVRIGGFFE
jgi:aryl-alcohol dehydrogenase-like predicted oxidoreductase